MIFKNIKSSVCLAILNWVFHPISDELEVVYALNTYQET
jgi:hypothetical protein